MLGRSSRGLLLVGLSLLFAVGVLFFPRIVQNPTYHHFADQRIWLGVPNALNVLSNIPIFALAAAGIVSVCRSAVSQDERDEFLTFFSAMLVLGLGSAYYHLSPSNSRLFLDRLPMGMAVMSLVALALSRQVDSYLGHLLLTPLCGLAAGSLLFWWLGERHGRGDLRFWWGFVEVYPVAFMAVVFLLFRPLAPGTSFLIAVVIAYGLGQLLDTLDGEIYASVGWISGHTLKHLAGALAVYLCLRGSWVRTTPPNTRAQRTRSPLTRRPLGRPEIS